MSRSEDDLIAFTIRKFTLDGKVDPSILAPFPMTKVCVNLKTVHPKYMYSTEHAQYLKFITKKINNTDCTYVHREINKNIKSYTRSRKQRLT